ncbi:MAG: serine/threonine protein kinase [Myxococcales bacterium]|nr:serine/threonine protein kinase [Myxococcales bacterium]MCB9715438.1 serine/threonine protein kinase [Myxococcales bacterium]
MATDRDPARADTERNTGEPQSERESPLQPGDVVGRRWRLDAFLDSGGMGDVWTATDLRLDEVVAIKLMDPRLVRTDAARERFMREARAAAQLRGSHVVSILDFDVDRRTDVPYMAMELLRGEDLGRRLSRGPLGYMQTLSVITDVCAAMGRAHRRSIVHRDLKPSNVFLVREDEETITKVLDFGIAKLALGSGGPRDVTTSGHTLGTVAYMSPEQIERPREVDTRADLWSIGVLACECLVGVNPFAGATPAETVHRICFKDPPVPSRMAEVPAGFDAWFATATAREPARRFQSAREQLEAFRALGASGAPKRASGDSMLDGELPRQAWASDANQIDIRALEDLTFRNSVVSEFLEEGTKHFVAGAKGLGKTLLLTYKRSLLSKRYQQLGPEAPRGQAVVQLIPEGRPYLDLMGDLRTPGKGHVDFMASLGNCKRAWGFALRVSAISHQPALVGRADADDLAAWPRRLRAMLEGRQAEPTIVVKELLSLPVGQLNRLLDESENFLEYKVRALHSGMFIFIDKVDQALRRLSREAWVHMQAGLIEAAWDLMNANRHLKVFATIREEAFSSYESDIKANLYGATTTLRYSKRDLRDMLEKLTHFYEGLPLRDFVSPEVVAGTSTEDEEAFDYVYRHTLGRPRDLVIIASEISRNRSALDERVFKRVVRETSAGIIVSNVFDEMRVFLDVLADKAQRMRFFALLPHGVLTYDELVEVWCRLHGVAREYFTSYGRDSPDVYHPFRELYDCGVLGIVARDGGRPVQRFKQPHDAIDGLHHELPRSSVYLLHPALDALVLRLGQGDGHHLFRHVVIGHDEPWPPRYDTLVEVQRALFRVATGEHREVEERVYDLLGELDRRVASGQDLGSVRLALARSPRMKQLLAQLDALGWDELHLVLLERFGEG